MFLILVTVALIVTLSLAVYNLFTYKTICRVCNQDLYYIKGKWWHETEEDHRAIPYERKN